MKKLTAIILCVFIIICMMSSTAVFAQEAPVAKQIIDVNDTDADTPPATDNYILTDDGDAVLEVRHVQTPGLTAALNDTTLNGYYTAEFMLPETNYRVFLTGLTENNVDEIRQEIINCYAEGEDFDMEDLGFIDTEKTWANDGDENLCWAASTSNLLTYTGWAAQAGFTSTDDVFEAYIDAFNDDGGNVEYATGWFINGIAAPGGAQPAAGSGKFLPQYDYSDIVETIDVYEACSEKLKTVYDRLKEGYGVSLSLDIYGSEGYEGAHAVSCWGFVTDIRYPATHKEHYKNVFITDSDSDQFWVQGDTERRDVEDVMSLYALDPVEQEGIDSYLFDITNSQMALITEAVTIMPYSADIPCETSTDATKNSLTTPDITIDPFVLTDDSTDDDETKTIFAPNATIYYHPYMMNVSSVTYSGPMYLTVTVKNAQGNTVYSRNFNYSSTWTIEPMVGSAFSKQSITPKLGVGDYTITASFNPNHNKTEAYYFNNVKTISFKVRESYIAGDADNDGSVTGIDVTLMQRYLARLTVNADDNFSQRGDINENGVLDLMDVTYLQRYLANADVLYPVNVSRYYD